MTTSDARKRIRENAAQAATTPAAVAVPEGGWRDGDWFVTVRRNVYALKADGRWHVQGDDFMPGFSYSSISFEQWASEGQVAYVHAPREDAPRPEPVTARCAAKHATNASFIPCMLDQGHGGDHWSTSGCPGGAVTWSPEPVTAPSSTLTLAADDWLAVVLIDDDGVAHLRDSGAIEPEALGTALRELADRVAPLPEPDARRTLLAAAQEMEYVIGEGDVAEACAPVPGEVGRSTVVGRRDALYEEPHTWLREYADRVAPDEPVTAPLPSEAVDALADQVRLAVPAMMPGLAERIAEALTAAGYTLPAADQRARDEDGLLIAVCDVIERALTTNEHADSPLAADSLASGLAVDVVRLVARDEGKVREKIALEIEATTTFAPEGTNEPNRLYRTGWGAAMKRAARIARGGTR